MMFKRCGPCLTSASSSESAPAPAPIVASGPQAALVQHVTLAPGSRVDQGKVVVKTWSVKNNGVEQWPEPTKLIFLRGDRELLGETEEFSVVCAKPGQTVEVSVAITTPTKAGNYSAYFQLANVDRKVFGPRLCSEVVVTRDDEDDIKLSPSATAAASVSASASASSSSSSLTKSPSSSPVDTTGWVDIKVETSPVVKPSQPSVVVPPVVLTPVTSVSSVPLSTTVTPSGTSVSSIPAGHVAVTSVPAVAPTPVKFESQLAALASMGFKNTELNSFLLEKNKGVVQEVVNWLLENMNH